MCLWYPPVFFAAVELSLVLVVNEVVLWGGEKLEGRRKLNPSSL